VYALYDAHVGTIQFNGLKRFMTFFNNPDMNATQAAKTVVK